MPKPCKQCKAPRTDWSQSTLLNAFCGPVCATDHARLKQDVAKLKAHRKARREFREANKPRSKWIAEAQAEVNRYIRIRDHYLPCMACGKFSGSDSLRGGGYDASHYRSRGSMPALRFHLLNIFRCCKFCNRELSGNIVEMRKNMVLKLGEERVQELEHCNPTVKYSIEDLKRIKSIFSRRARLYKKLREGRGEV